MKKSTKIMLGAAAAAKLAYLLLSPRFATRLYHSRLFRDDQGRGPEILLNNFCDCENRQVWFEGGNRHRLRGWLFKHPTSELVFFYCMGRASDIPRNLAHVRMLLDCGASVFIFEYRGFGQSQGSPNLQGVVEDAHKAFAVLVNELGYSDQIITYGKSLGGGIGTELLKQFQPLGHIVQSSYESLEVIAKEMLPLLKIYPRQLFPHPRLATAETLSKNSTPVLVIVGVHDDVIPHQHSLRIYDAACGAKFLALLQNSGHRAIEHTDRQAFVAAVSEFLRFLQSSDNLNPEPAICHLSDRETRSTRFRLET